MNAATKLKKNCKMNYENIKFVDDTTERDKLIALVKTYAGSPRLKIEMNKVKVNYSKLERGLKVVYVLRRSDIGKIEVVL